MNKQADFENVINHDYKAMKVNIMAKKEKVNGVVMNGKAVVNLEKNQINFIQNMTHQKKNPIAYRSTHFIFRRHPDGDIRASIRFDPNEKLLFESLASELRRGIKEIETKLKKQ